MDCNKTDAQYNVKRIENAEPENVVVSFLINILSVYMIVVEPLNEIKFIINENKNYIKSLETPFPRLKDVFIQYISLKFNDQLEEIEKSKAEMKCIIGALTTKNMTDTKSLIVDAIKLVTQ